MKKDLADLKECKNKVIEVQESTCTKKKQLNEMMKTSEDIKTEFTKETEILKKTQIEI